MRRALLGILFASGCAAPFVEVPSAQPSTAAVRVTSCGTSGMRASSVVAAMDGPPLGETGSGMEPQKEVEVCLQIGNHGHAPLEVDRSRVYLKAPHETQTPIGDKDDDRFVVPVSETRKFKVAFHYSTILSGQDCRLDFDQVVKAGDRPITLPPITLRRR
jgi:hypothetical protein